MCYMRLFCLLACTLLARLCACQEVLPYAVAAGEAAFPLPQAPCWRLDRLFHRTTVELSCSGARAQRYELFSARSAEEALACAARSGTLGGARSSLAISPLGTTWLSLRRADGWLRGGKGGDVPDCSVHVSSAFSNARLALALAGFFLFRSAQRCVPSERVPALCCAVRDIRSENVPCLADSPQHAPSASPPAGCCCPCPRCSSWPSTSPGAQQRRPSDLLSPSDPPPWCHRSALPGRRVRAVLAALGVVTSTLWSPLLRELTPSLDTLSQSPLLVCYFALTFVLGMLLTAFMERGGAHQSMTEAIAHVLRACGAALVLLGVQDGRVALSLVTVMAASEALRGVAPAVAHALRCRPVLQSSPPASTPGSPGGSQSLTFPTALSPLGRETSLDAWFNQAPASGAGAAPARSPALSPLLEEAAIVRSGSIFNTSTGKSVKIGGATYQRLVDQGYVADRVAGTLSPAPQTTPASASPQLGSGVKPRRLSAAMARESEGAGPPSRGAVTSPRRRRG